jgi:predicted nucleotidyltransferase
MIVPILGTRTTGLADALFTKTQQRVLGVLFGNPRANFHAQDVIRQARVGTGAAQRELVRLEQSGLVTSTRIGRQKHYQANPDSALFSELSSIVQKTVGLAEPIRRALRPLSNRIRAAFVYGSVARGRDRASSDIDLMMVSDDVTYADVFEVLERTSKHLGRPINPTVYDAKDFAKRMRDRNAFLRKVMDAPKIWIIGSERELPI